MRHAGRRWSSIGKTAWMGVMACVLFIASATAARADSSAEEAPDHFALGTKALAAGRYQVAIDQLEAHADRASPHPDASYNRGLAYVMRVKNGAEKPGDLGRAAAAFEEALILRPDDEEARAAVEAVHAEVARRRARRGKDSVIARPTLDRVVIGLASESTWGIAAIVASFLCALGLGLRWGRGSVRLAGVLLAPTAFVAMLILTPLWWSARNLRLETEPAVLVVTEAFLTDADGSARDGSVGIPEAARLELHERKDGRVRVRYAGDEGWLPAAYIRVLRQR